MLPWDSELMKIYDPIFASSSIQSVRSDAIDNHDHKDQKYVHTIAISAPYHVMHAHNDCGNQQCDNNHTPEA